MDSGEQRIDDFLSAIASEKVTPAGGTAAAVVGATGASLCEMVCIHTVQKDEHAHIAAELSNVADDLRGQRTALLDLADKDSAAVDALLDATDDAIERKAKRATGVPLAIAEACLNVLKLATDVTAKGTPNAVPDAGTGVLLARSALQASLFTVQSNLGAVDDPSFVEEMERRTAEIETEAERAFEDVAKNVGEHYPQ